MEGTLQGYSFRGAEQDYTVEGRFEVGEHGSVRW